MLHLGAKWQLNRHTNDTIHDSPWSCNIEHIQHTWPHILAFCRFWLVMTTVIGSVHCARTLFVDLPGWPDKERIPALNPSLVQQFLCYLYFVLRLHATHTTRGGFRLRGPEAPSAGGSQDYVPQAPLDRGSPGACPKCLSRNPALHTTTCTWPFIDYLQNG